MRSKTLLSRLSLTSAAVAVTALAAPAMAAAAPGPPSPVTPACAWIEYSPSTINVAAPDNSATYWVLPFTVQDGLRIVLDGRYPDARYASLQAYKAGGGLFSTNGVISSLTDYRIEPDRGSVNPWQRRVGWHGQRAGGRFTVTLRSDVAPGEANTIPLAPSGVTSGPGYLIYRVYLPARDDFSRVPLPGVTFMLNGVSARVPACQPGTASTSAASSADAALAPASVAPVPASATATSAGTGSTGGVEFARPVPGSGGFPNADSGYLYAVVTPPGNGDVIVIQGKAPASSKGNHPSPWPPAPGIDMRYWSMCDYLAASPVPLVVNQLPDGTVDYGCRNDRQTVLNRRGYYTYVVGTEAQRGAIERIPGATFVPFSTEQSAATHVLLLRNMLVAANFAEAIQNVPQNGSPASAAAVMGAYYPRAAICPLAALASGGPPACLPAPS